MRRDALNGSNVEISFDAPTKDWAGRRTGPALNLYLYDIQEDLERRRVQPEDVLDQKRHILRRPKHVNFDYGFWDDASQSFWHANNRQPGMEVFQSTKEHFIRGYRDFDRCVFGVALATNYDPAKAATDANHDARPTTTASAEGAWDFDAHTIAENYAYARRAGIGTFPRSYMTDLNQMVDRDVTIEGTARNRAFGAVVMIDNDEPVYVDGLREWDETVDGKKVRAKGTLLNAAAGPT